jgi:hypothetical protein
MPMPAEPPVPLGVRPSPRSRTGKPPRCARPSCHGPGRDRPSPPPVRRLTRRLAGLAAHHCHAPAREWPPRLRSCDRGRRLGCAHQSPLAVRGWCSCVLLRFGRGCRAKGHHHRLGDLRTTGPDGRRHVALTAVSAIVLDEDPGGAFGDIQSACFHNGEHRRDGRNSAG